MPNAPRPPSEASRANRSNSGSCDVPWLARKENGYITFGILRTTADAKQEKTWQEPWRTTVMMRNVPNNYTRPGCSHSVG